MATHSSVLACRIPGTGAWWAAVYGVAQSWTRLKQFSSNSSMPLYPEIHNINTTLKLDLFHMYISYMKTSYLIYMIMNVFFMIILHFFKNDLILKHLNL